MKTLRVYLNMMEIPTTILWTTTTTQRGLQISFDLALTRWSSVLLRCRLEQQMKMCPHIWFFWRDKYKRIISKSLSIPSAQCSLCVAPIFHLGLIWENECSAYFSWCVWSPRWRGWHKKRFVLVSFDGQKYVWVKFCVRTWLRGCRTYDGSCQEG